MCRSVHMCVDVGTEGKKNENIAYYNTKEKPI